MAGGSFTSTNSRTTRATGLVELSAVQLLPRGVGSSRIYAASRETFDLETESHGRQRDAQEECLELGVGHSHVSPAITR